METSLLFEVTCEVEDLKPGGDRVGGGTPVLAHGVLAHVGELQGELVPGEPGDGDVWLGGEEEVGGSVPADVEPPYSPDTAQQGHLQSGGVHCPGLLDAHHGGVLYRLGVLQGYS